MLAEKEEEEQWESEHVRMMYSDKMAVPETQTRVKVVSILVDSKSSVLEQRSCWVPLLPDGVMPESVLLGFIHAERHQRADKRRFQLIDIQTSPFLPVVIVCIGRHRRLGRHQPSVRDLVVLGAPRRAT